MEAKDTIAIAGIGATFVASAATLVYTVWSNKQNAFINTI
jgi:hypothetical protein